IGAHPTALSQLVIPHLGEMHAQYPLVQIRLSEDEAPECFDQLIIGGLDAAIIAAHAGVLPASDRRFHQQRLVAEPIDALVGSALQLAERASIELSERTAERWVLIADRHSVRVEILSASHAAGFWPSDAHDGHITQSLANLVEATGEFSLS